MQVITTNWLFRPTIYVKTPPQKRTVLIHYKIASQYSAPILSKNSYFIPFPTLLWVIKPCYNLLELYACANNDLFVMSDLPNVIGSSVCMGDYLIPKFFWNSKKLAKNVISKFWNTPFSANVNIHETLEKCYFHRRLVQWEQREQGKELEICLPLYDQILKDKLLKKIKRLNK